MTTLWDVTDVFSSGAEVTNAQRQEPRPKGPSSLRSVATVVALAVASLNAPIVRAEAAVTSANTIVLRRAVPAKPTTQAKRGQRDEFQPDRKIGKSTRRLATSAEGLFRPRAVECDQDVDFIFE